jgi:hypothetical protein
MVVRRYCQSAKILAEDPGERGAGAQEWRLIAFVDTMTLVSRVPKVCLV